MIAKRLDPGREAGFEKLSVQGVHHVIQRIV
jgi:hypothetical protein